MYSRLPALILCFAALLCGLNPGRVCAAPTFSLTDVGAAGTIPVSHTVVGMNDNGDVVGTYILPGGGGTMHSFVATGGTVTDIGAFGQFINCQAVGISNSGDIAGNCTMDFQYGSPEAFIYHQGVMTSLGDLGGHTSTAVAINASGAIAGYSTNANFQTHAFIYQNGVMTDLGELGGVNHYSQATCVSPNGTVAGIAFAPDFTYHMFTWANGVMTDRGLVNGKSGAPVAVNDAGQFAGTYNIQPDPFGYVEDTGGFLFSGG